MGSVRIKIIVPVSTDKWNKGIRELCEEVKNPDTEIDIVNIKKGPVSIESEYDEALSAPYTIEEAIKAEEEGYQGVIIYCFANPALFAVREVIKIPAVGIGEAAHMMGMIVGERIGIIATIENAVPRNWRRTKLIGSKNKVMAIKALNLPVLEYSNKEKTFLRVKEVAQSLIKDFDVDCIILGCGSILGMKEEIKRSFSIPIIIPGEAAVKLVESMVKMKISHSKKTFQTPPEKEIKK